MDSFIPPQFECQVEPERDRFVLRPKGELDIATAPQVDTQVEELVKSGFKNVVVDLAGLTFLDSTGLRLFLKWSQTARSDGVAFSLLPGTASVARVFEISGLDDQLPFLYPEDLRRR